MTDRIMSVAEATSYAERDRLAAGEICVDEALTIFERRGLPLDHPLMVGLQMISKGLHMVMTQTDGPEARLARIVRIRRALTVAMPLTDADLEKADA